MANNRDNRNHGNRPPPFQSGTNDDKGNDSRQIKAIVREGIEAFHLLSEQTLLCIVILQDGVIKYANQAVSDFLGYSIDEILSWEPNGFARVIHPDDLPFVMEQGQKKQAGEEDVVPQYSYRMIAKDGQIRWINQFSYTIKYENRFADLVTFIDITGSKQIEQELRKQSNFIDAILETAGALVIVMDPCGQIIRFNRACEQVSGYSFDEARGRYLWDLVLAPEEIEAVKGVFDGLRSGLFPSQFENYWVNKDGSRRWIMWSNTALVDDSGKVEFVIGTGIDITERKLTEESLKQAHGELERQVKERTQELEEANRRKKAMFDLYTIFELSRNFNAMLDYQSLLDSFILAAEGRVGATRTALYLPLTPSGKGFQLARAKGAHPFPEGQIGVHQDGACCRYITNLNRPISVEEIKSKFSATEDVSFIEHFTGGLVIPLVFQMKLRGILILSVKESGQAYMDSDIEFLSILANQTAVSIENARLYESEKEALYKLQNTQKLLVQSERSAALGALSAKIAHEINNPLGIIKNYLSLTLQNIEQPNKAVEHLKIVRQEIDRIASIVRQLLDFHRPVSVSFKRINLEKAIREILTLMERQLEAAEVSVSLNFDDTTPEIVAWADGLKQVFINIMVNAVDAMGESGEISITINHTKHTVIILFEDTGPGIEPENIPHIFDSFFTTKTAAGGSGLGLSICYRIIKNHNGSITFTNTERGGRFKIELPIDQEDIEYDRQI